MALSNVKYETVYNGIKTKWNAKMFGWSIFINGFHFEFNTGLGHATKYHMSDFSKTKTSISLQQAKQKVTKLGKEYINDQQQHQLIHVPPLTDVLDCLFSDYECGNMNFDDFCDNLGYNPDSFKDFETYKCCMEIGKDLRSALGKDFHAIKEYIESERN